MAAILQRISKSFAIHLTLLLVALGLIYAVVRGQDSLGAAIRLQYEGQSSEVLLQLVADARGRIMAWCLVSFAIGWLASAVFLASAQRSQPSNERQAASLRGLWSGLMLFTVFAVGVLGWLRLFNLGVSTDLASGSFMIAVIGIFVLVLLGYYFGTGLAVKAAMRPSVPGATALPTFWS